MVLNMICVKNARIWINIKNRKMVNKMEIKYEDLFNKGNDCDMCQNSYYYGLDGDKIGCKRADDKLDCEFVEAKGN